MPRAKSMGQLMSIKLSPEEQRFAELLLEDYPPIEAYIIAGFDDNDPKLIEHCDALLHDDRVRLYQLSVKVDPANATEHLTRGEWLSRLTSIAMHGVDDKIRLEALSKIGQAEGWFKPSAENENSIAIREWALKVKNGEIPLAAVPVHFREAVQQLELPEGS